MTDFDLLLPRPTVTQTSYWATVTQVSPLRIRLDGDPGPLPLTPDTLVSDLSVGDRVYVEMHTNADPARYSRRVVVLGRAGGAGTVTSWATVTQASPLRIRLDGESDPLPFTPDTLVAGLGVGDRVYVLLAGNADPAQAVVLGRAGGAGTVTSQSYTPLLLASTTNPSLGSTGEAVGRYWLYPDGRVWGDIFIRFGGSGISPGSGRYSVTLPTPALGFLSGSTGQADLWGWFTIRDNSSASASRLGYLTRASVDGGPGGVAVADLSILDGTQPYVGDNYPWVWASGDAIAGSFDYMRPV